MKYIKWLRNDFNKAVKEFRKRHKELNPAQWEEANNIIMKHAGKRDWKTGNQPKYFDYVSKLVQSGLVPSGSILDCGCGAGFMLYKLHNLGYRNMMGIDSSKACIDKCNEMNDKYNTNITFENINMELISLYPIYKSDLILCCEVLEHVPIPSSILDIIQLNLNDDGTAIFTMPKLDEHSSFTHINLFYDDVDPVYMNKKAKLYNRYRVNSMFRRSKFSRFSVKVIRNYYIVVAEK